MTRHEQFENMNVNVWAFGRQIQMYEFHVNYDLHQSSCLIQNAVSILQLQANSNWHDDSHFWWEFQTVFDIFIEHTKLMRFF